MKHCRTGLSGLCGVGGLISSAHAQKTETYDVSTYTVPKGWQKKPDSVAVQLSTTSPKRSCTILVFKATPGTTDPKANFTGAWKMIVGSAVTPSSPPERQPALSVVS